MFNFKQPQKLFLDTFKKGMVNQIDKGCHTQSHKKGIQASHTAGILFSGFIISQQRPYPLGYAPYNANFICGLATEKSKMDLEDMFYEVIGNYKNREGLNYKKGTQTSHTQILIFCFYNKLSINI